MSNSKQLNIRLFSVYRSFPLQTLNKRTKRNETKRASNKCRYAQLIFQFSLLLNFMCLYSMKCCACTANEYTRLLFAFISLSRATHIFVIHAFHFFRSFFVDRTRILALYLYSELLAIVRCFSWKNNVHRNGRSIFLELHLNTNINRHINFKSNFYKR